MSLCNYMDVYENEHVTGNGRFMRATATTAEIDRFALKPGDVIITKDSERPDDIAVPAVVRPSVPEDLVCGYHLALLRPDESLCLGPFLARVLAHRWVTQHFYRSANGTTRYGLTQAAIHAAPIPLPPLPEQERIADILDTIDETIQQSDELIAKLENMQEGLLQDLLTRGLDEGEEVRDPDRNPELFKETSLGLLPQSWQVVPIASTALPHGNSFVDGDWIESPYIVESGIRLIQTGNIGRGHFVDKEDSQRFISPQTFRLLNCTWVHPGDILICRMADPMGRSCIVPKKVGDSVTAVDCTIYRPDPDVVDLDYAIAWLNSDVHLKMAADRAGGSTRQRISRTNLGGIPMPLPPLPEQRRIGKVLRAAKSRLEGEQRGVNKLRVLKRALVDDLITGRARIHALEEAVP